MSAWQGSCGRKTSSWRLPLSIKKRNIITKKQCNCKGNGKGKGKGNGKGKYKPEKKPTKRKTKGVSGRTNHTENTFVEVTPKRKRRLPRKP